MVASTWKSRMELIAENPFTVDAMAIVTTCARLADYAWQKNEKGLRSSRPRELSPMWYATADQALHTLRHHNNPRFFSWQSDSEQTNAVFHAIRDLIACGEAADGERSTL